MPDPTSLAMSLAPLLIAMFFFAVGAVSLASTALWRGRAFPRLPGYPPILEFYRLRI